MTEIKKDKEKGMALYRQEVKEIIANKEVFNDLANNVFKKLNNINIPIALMQGRMKGFSIEDFMVGNIYAVPFWNKREQKQEFSLVNSIDYVRKIAMRSGQSGKSEPRYEFTEDKKILSCSVTVWRKGGDERGYTAKVYFSEYDTGLNLWVSKPMTMIAKVAEMHALRAAFPEELQHSYIEEEFEKRVVDVVETNNKQIISDELISQIKNCKTIKELTKIYKDNSGLGKEFDSLISEKKKELLESDKTKEVKSEKDKPKK